eukprot:4144172-Alexandrium_andersonii.AAC.1
MSGRLRYGWVRWVMSDVKRRVLKDGRWGAFGPLEEGRALALSCLAGAGRWWAGSSLRLLGLTSLCI